MKENTAKEIKEMQRRRSPDLFESTVPKKPAAKSRITFPSQQHHEDNRSELEALQQKLTVLGTQKQIVCCLIRVH